MISDDNKNPILPQVTTAMLLDGGAAARRWWWLRRSSTLPTRLQYWNQRANSRSRLIPAVLLPHCLPACTTKGSTTLHALISQFYIVPGLSSASSSRCTVAYRSVTAGGKRGRGAYSQPAKEHRCHRCDATTHTWGF